ncbi:MAG TPA: hypothetical protein VF155_13095 [Candidatus Dormibacteraeota bacterium]
MAFEVDEFGVFDVPFVHPMQVFSAGMSSALAEAELDESLDDAFELLAGADDDAAGSRGTGRRLFTVCCRLGGTGSGSDGSGPAEAVIVSGAATAATSAEATAALAIKRTIRCPPVTDLFLSFVAPPRRS